MANWWLVVGEPSTKQLLSIKRVTVNKNLAVKLCNAYAQLGARGTSVLFASGDGGVSGPQANNDCDGQAFSPTFPSGCPL